MELRRSGNSIEMVEEQSSSSEEGQNARLHTTPEMPARANLMQATKTHIHMIFQLRLGLNSKLLGFHAVLPAYMAPECVIESTDTLFLILFHCFTLLLHGQILCGHTTDLNKDCQINVNNMLVI